MEARREVCGLFSEPCLINCSIHLSNPINNHSKKIVSVKCNLHSILSAKENCLGCLI